MVSTQFDATACILRSDSRGEIRKFKQYLTSNGQLTKTFMLAATKNWGKKNHQFLKVAINVAMRKR